MNFIPLCFVLTLGFLATACHKEEPLLIAEPPVGGEMYQTDFRELQGGVELAWMPRFCRIHEIRLGYRLKKEAQDFQLADATLRNYSAKDASVDSERIGVRSAVDGTSWVWSCIGCEEGLDPMSGPLLKWDAPVARMSQLTCRVHGHLLSPVAGKKARSRWDSHINLEARIHFPNAGRAGHAEFIHHVIDLETSWLSSCPECEINWHEYWMKIVESLGGCEY